MDLPEPDEANSKMTPSQDVTAAQSSQVSLGAVTRPLAALALLSSIIGRGLSVALPGTRAGIGDWITFTNLLGAVLTQLTVILGATLGALLMLTTLWQRRFPYLFRLIAMPAGAAVLTLVALSTRHNLAPPEALGLAACATLLATASAVVSLRAVSTRAVGLVLALAVLAAAAYTGARGLNWLDIILSQNEWHRVSRWLATIGWCFDVLCLVLAATTLLATRTTFARFAAPLALGAAAVIAWAATRGSLDGASLGQVLASRTLVEMTPGPAPLLPSMARYLSAAYAHTLAAALIVNYRRVGTAHVAIALAVLSRSSPEIPVCALLFVLAAVLAPIGSLTQEDELEDPS